MNMRRKMVIKRRFGFFFTAETNNILIKEAGK